MEQMRSFAVACLRSGGGGLKIKLRGMARLEASELDSSVESIVRQTFRESRSELENEAVEFQQEKQPPLASTMVYF